MALFDTLIEQTNDDLKDLLGLLRDRVRWLYGFIVQGIVDNPGVSVSAARSAVVSAYAAQFPTDNFLSLNPGNCFDALVNRHGVGANANQKWSDFKTKVLAITDGGVVFKSLYLESLEEGTLPPLGELILSRVKGSPKHGIPQPPDVQLVQTSDSEGRLTSRRWHSPSMNKTVLETYVYTTIPGGYDVSRSVEVL